MAKLVYFGIGANKYVVDPTVVTLNVKFAPSDGVGANTNTYYLVWPSEWQLHDILL